MTKLALAAGQKKLASTKYIEFPTLICRKISTKNDEENGFLTYVGQADVSAFLDIPEDENVRQYLLDAGERGKKSGVHIAIEESLRNRPENFSVLNGGICIVAQDAVLQDDQKTIRMVKPSIINGSQTRGVIRDYLQTLDSESTSPAKVKFELIVTKDSDLADEISIARNFQITVKLISILGKRGYFEEIEKHFKDYSGQNRPLRTSETDRVDVIWTEKLIQVITALIPVSLWPATGRGADYWNKAFTYSSTAGPLRLFEQVYKKAKEEKDPDAIKLYQFYIQVASEAWQLYEKWSQHPGFKGTKLINGITRDEYGNIKNVVDGIIFPIIASFSAFMKFENGKWKLSPPSIWSDENIIVPAKGQFQSAADSNPQTMGKDKSIYQSLYNLTELVARLGAQ